MEFLVLSNMVLLLAIQQETETNFNDLGIVLLAGFVGALVFALAFTFVRLRLREKKPQTSNFVSIGTIRDENSR